MVFIITANLPIDALSIQSTYLYCFKVVCLGIYLRAFKYGISSDGTGERPARQVLQLNKAVAGRKYEYYFKQTQVANILDAKFWEVFYVTK